MTKSDLTTGKHIVELRDGRVGLVVDGGFLFNDWSYMKNKFYNKKLLNRKLNKQFDIIKIGTFNLTDIINIMYRNLCDNVNWIWERNNKEATK